MKVHSTLSILFLVSIFVGLTTLALPIAEASDDCSNLWPPNDIDHVPPLPPNDESQCLNLNGEYKGTFLNYVEYMHFQTSADHGQVSYWFNWDEQALSKWDMKIAADGNTYADLADPSPGKFYRAVCSQGTLDLLFYYPDSQTLFTRTQIKIVNSNGDLHIIKCSPGGDNGNYVLKKQ